MGIWPHCPLQDDKELCSKPCEHFNTDSNDQKAEEKQRNLRSTRLQVLRSIFYNVLLSSGLSAAAGDTHLQMNIVEGCL